LTTGRALVGARLPRMQPIEWLMLGLVLAWGINFAVVKIALRSFEPLASNALRFALASLIMLVFALQQGERFRLSPREAISMALLGLVGHALYQISFINGLARTSAGNASLLLGTSPIFVALISHFFGIERAKARVWLGVLISFGGSALLVIGSGRQTSVQGSTAAGDLLIIAAAVCWAAYTTFSQPVLARRSPITLTTVSMLIGTPMIVLVSVPQLARQDWGAVPIEGWLCLVYSGAIAIALGYVLWAYAVRRMGNVRTAVYQNMIPIVAGVTGWLVLGDPVRPLQVAAAAIVLSGIALTRAGRGSQIRRTESNDSA